MPGAHADTLTLEVRFQGPGARPGFPFHTTKLGETIGQGNIYNPFILWFPLPPRSTLPPILGRRRKTLLNPRNQVRRVGLQRVWVP
jgi:hypothetical protein